jgi:hypothetical protein
MASLSEVTWDIEVRQVQQAPEAARSHPTNSRQSARTGQAEDTVIACAA